MSSVIKPFFHTQRITKSTRQRAENMLKVLEAFKTFSSIDAIDMQSVLGYSPSGTRRYLADLVRYQVITIHLKLPATKDGKAEYRLTTNEETVNNFEKSLRGHLESDASKAKQYAPGERPIPVTRARLTLQEKYPDRQIHLADDDFQIGIRMVPNKGEGKRDPLVAALFGPAKRSFSYAE